MSIEKIELQRKSRIFSAAERTLFECLVNSLNEDFYIFAKFGILDAVEPSSSANWLHTKQLKSRLKDESFDYLLCKKSDLSVFGAIELENFDQDTNKKMRASREKLISTVCKSANIKLFYFDIRQDYREMDIRRLVTGKSAPASDEKTSATHQSRLSVDSQSVSAFGHMRSCPKCHSELVTKVAVKGKRIGEKFLMCRKYPYCDYQLSMKDAEMQKMQQKEAQRAKKPGFSDWT